MRTIRWLAWSVGVLFLIGTAFQLVDLLNLYATPPDTNELNMVEAQLAGRDYRVAIWPVFLLSNLSIGVGFVALAGLGFGLASMLASGDGQRTVIATSLGVAGVLGAVAQLILIGAAQVTVEIAYCDCGFKETEIVSQIWAQMLANGASEWLVNGAAVLGGIGILAVDAAFRRRMPAAWDIVSWLTAAGLIVTVVVGVFRLGYELGLYLLLIVSGVLVPIWAIWLGTSLRARPGSEPDTVAGAGAT
jgi:hypothetical protein